jgi:glucose-6-phosphate isomerase
MPDRLGWTRAVPESQRLWPVWSGFATAVRRDGLDRVLICGMGGSSLAPQVLVRSFGVTGVDVLDSTDPAAVRAAELAHPLERTLFLIVSKSGSTVETLAAYHYFAARARPDQFVAVTDPGSPSRGSPRSGSSGRRFPIPSTSGAAMRP